MKFVPQDLQLSGKGAIVSNELVHENIKLITQQTQFHEVVVMEDDQAKRVGWLVPNSFQLLADFVTHTEKGMRGKSTDDTIERALLMDGNGLLTQIFPESLIDLDTSESEEILRTMLEGDQFKGNMQIDDINETDALIILSPKTKFVFVQTEDASIRIHGSDGVYVLKRDGEAEKLVIIGQHEGVNIFGDKEIIIGPGGMVIDGKPFNPAAIISSAMAGLGPALAGLGAIGNLGNAFNFGNFGNFDFDADVDFDMDDFEDTLEKKMHKMSMKMEKMGRKMEKMGEKLAKEFGENFGKNFAMNFGSSFDFDSDFDDDEVAHDVSVDFDASVDTEESDE